MLQAFVAGHRQELIDRCRKKTATRIAPRATIAEVEHGVPMFLDQLVAELRGGLPSNATSDIAKMAAKHGHDQLNQGFTPSQVVHGYGDRTAITVQYQ